MLTLKEEIASCEICKNSLGHTPRPVCTFSATSKIMIIGQAPGSRVHQSGIPWDDKSGANLRAWMDLDKSTFYDEQQIAIMPMGFCYPGKGKNGDLPPRKECAPMWHQPILSITKELKLILLIGKYAQDYYLKKETKRNLTETVRHYNDYLPAYFVLPHSSPRNNIWMKKNPWFKREVLPILKFEVEKAIRS